MAHLVKRARSGYRGDRDTTLGGWEGKGVCTRCELSGFDGTYAGYVMRALVLALTDMTEAYVRLY